MTNLKNLQKRISQSEKAFARNVAEQRERFLSYFRSITKNESTANDLVQEVFLTAHRQYMLGLYIENGKLQNYLMKIAGNLLRDYFRETKRHQDGLEDYLNDINKNFGWSEHVGDYLTKTIEETDVETRVSLANNMLNSKFNNCPVLNFTEQRILQMRHGGNLSFLKISEMLNCPVTTIAFKYKVAIRKIRGAISSGDIQ
jgi:RNA polymerase sigma-70 factor (ECF subfamily)